MSKFISTATMAAVALTWTPVAFAQSSTTEVLCHFRANTSQIDPRSEYLRAEQADGTHLKLNGKFTDGDRNAMFIAEAAEAQVRKACIETLSKHQKPIDALYINAASRTTAPATLATEHRIWYQGDNALPPTKSWNRIVVFGDSMSDTNNIFNASFQVAPRRKSWYWGHFSNGPVWAEHLGQLLGVGTSNWAYGGAKAFNTGSEPTPDLKQQIATFLSRIVKDPGFKIDRTLFAVFVGGNDIRQKSNVDDAVNAMDAELRTLIGKGAKHIVVLTLPDFSAAPDYKNPENQDEKNRTHNDITNFNIKLKAAIGRIQSELGTESNVYLVDIEPIVATIIARPEDFNFANSTDSCLQIDTPFNHNDYQEEFPTRQSCQADPRFVFWDKLHLTSDVHRIIASKVRNELLFGRAMR